MAPGTSPFGRSLRHWRRLRGVSQLELAGLAATTTRYLSYLETGRARPSQQMVARLADALQVPLRERNGLLEKAGLAPMYPEGDLAAEELAPFGQAIARLLASHDPYPGFVVESVTDIALDEIRIELIYPADSPSEQFFRDLATS